MRHRIHKLAGGVALPLSEVIEDRQASALSATHPAWTSRFRAHNPAHRHATLFSRHICENLIRRSLRDQQKILKFFKGKHLNHITICNRTDVLAHKMAEGYGCNVLQWPCLQSTWHQFDWIVFGTKAPEPIITQRSLPQESKGSKLIIDLSVPRNVDAGLARDSRVTLLNIDQLNKTLF